MTRLEGWGGLVRPHIVSAVVAGSLVAACGTTAPPEPEVRIVETLVPVPVSCVPEGFRVDPDFQVDRQNVVAASAPDEAYRLLAVGFLERDAYINRVRPVIEGCVAAGSVQP